jgi:minor histocompatibility antigen H13
MTRLNFISLLISIFPIIVYLSTKNWLCNNIFGVAFSIAGIANFTVLPNFKVVFFFLFK